MADEIVGGGNTGAADAAAGGNTGAASGVAAGGNTGTGQQGNTGNTKPTFTYNEDRSKWIPNHRLSEETTKRTAAEKKIQELEAAHTEAQRRIAVLAGVNPQDPDAAEMEEIRSQFSRLRPDLAKLDDSKIERLLQIADKFDEIEGSVQANWDAHGKRSFKHVTDKVETAIGGELTERQRTKLNDALVLTLYNNPELKARYDQGDTALLDDFASEWIEDWFEPARRQATAQVVNRGQKPMPNGRGAGVTVSTKPKVDVNDPEAFKKALGEAYREEGGNFGFKKR